MRVYVYSFQFLGIPPKGELVLAIIHGLTGTLFPISRDPPEGGTTKTSLLLRWFTRFQFLGIPPKGEQLVEAASPDLYCPFPISRDPPEGGTSKSVQTGTVRKRGVSNF